MLKKLFPGENLKDLSYDTITDKLKKHYDKSDSEVIHSFKFWSRKQGQHEKAEDYVLSVKVLAERCCFGDFRDRAIRDVLVMGVFDRGLQKRLFDEDNLTADKAEKMILNQELSSNRTRILNNGDDGRSSLVNRLGRRPDRTPNKGGYRNRSRSNNRTRSFSSDRNKNKSDSGKPTFFCTFYISTPLQPSIAGRSHLHRAPGTRIEDLEDGKCRCSTFFRVLRENLLGILSACGHRDGYTLRIGQLSPQPSDKDKELQVSFAVIDSRHTACNR
ncbi:conserved hypothetical protein [Culex quinquefasciatus]|uniref:Uncharacterized protein n=1 Tax=Culex quinquefasciatus TaxID=7176 RepID=B0XH87_CULQU|nr:conserved hypothetical protein [Culex quinquefasciatus]|eukprot:XP_001869009.1 conserved hypothetical protein [Culex quinquefasciatus]